MTLEPPVKPLRQRLIDLGLLLAVVVALAFSAPAVHLGDMGMLFSHSSNMQHFLAGMRHPDFDHWRDYAQDMFLTLQMALWGSFLAVLLAAPLGLLAARNVAPVYIQQPVRRLLDALRSVPDLVVGTLFVLAVGLGPLAGVLAIALNTGGVLGKLFSEAVESIDPAPVEGVRAVGARGEGDGEVFHREQRGAHATQLRRGHLDHGRGEGSANSAGAGLGAGRDAWVSADAGGRQRVERL